MSKEQGLLIKVIVFLELLILYLMFISIILS
jgi:hypothetical protein